MKVVSGRMFSFLMVGLTFAVTSSLMGAVMTFDTVPSGTPLPYDGVYTENGMMAISKSYHSQIGDPIGDTLFVTGLTTNGLYFHGTDEYIEFRKVDGSTFDLVSLDFFTNGYGNRWLKTSSGVTIPLPGYQTVTTIPFSGSDFSNIDWFQVGTPWFATEVDNVTVDVIPAPAALVLGSIVVGFVGWLRRRRTQ